MLFFSLGKSSSFVVYIAILYRCFKVFIRSYLTRYNTILLDTTQYNNHSNKKAFKTTVTIPLPIIRSKKTQKIIMSPATTSLKSILFSIHKTIDKKRPSSLQNPNLCKVNTQTSVTRSLYEERKRKMRKEKKKERKERNERRLYEVYYAGIIGFEEWREVQK